MIELSAGRSRSLAANPLPPTQLRILVIEDNPADMEHCIRELSKAGLKFHADRVDSREAFITTLQSQVYDLILADFSIPGWSGLDAFYLLKESGKDIPFIILSGTLGEEAAIDLIRNGITDYVLKDRWVRLLPAIQRALDDRVARQERARTDENLRRLAALVQCSDDAIIGKTIDGLVLSWNTGAERIYGYSAAEVIGKPVNFLVPADRPDELPAIMEKLQRGEKVEHFETTRIRKDGMHVHVSLAVSSVKDASGRIVGYSVIARDITESKKAEERFSKAFNASPEPITIANFSEGRYIDVNESFLRVTGYMREEVIGRTSTELKFWERPEDRVRLVEALKRQGSVRDLEITFLTKSGEQRTGLDSAEVIEIAGQKCVLAIFKDVTEKKNLEQQLRHAQKLEAIGGLAAGMAHEINTPIQFVGDNARFLQDSFHGIADLIDRYEELCEEADQGAVRPELLERARTAREKADWAYLRAEVPKALEQMLDGVGRVATIVRAMKEFSHVDQSVEKTAADLNKALESTLVVARNELRFVAEVETHYGELPLVMCHLGDLNQVFLNLLVNAAHAIGDAVKGTGEKGRIGVRTKQEGEWVEIAISDTGTGVPERIRERIFDPFFTTKEVGKGSGQGLALARAIVVEKHGGTLTFETELGKGTTFYVRLPVNSAREAKELVAR